jgi:hypothetical protein
VLGIADYVALCVLLMVAARCSNQYVNDIFSSDPLKHLHRNRWLSSLGLRRFPDLITQLRAPNMYTRAVQPRAIRRH